MSAISYTVVATFPDRVIAEEYLQWLNDGHVSAVVRGGAVSGIVVRVTDPARPIQIESRYVFPDMGAFERYVVETAPGLRADGMRRFGPERGVRLERRIGQIVEGATRTTPARAS